MTDVSTQPETPKQQSNQLLKAIDFGFQVEAFLASEVGQYLIKRAEGQVEEAVEKLKYADPSNVEGIRSLQSEIKVAEQIQYWLADAIGAGNAAQDELIDQSS